MRTKNQGLQLINRPFNSWKRLTVRQIRHFEEKAFRHSRWISVVAISLWKRSSTQLAIDRVLTTKNLRNVDIIRKQDLDVRIKTSINAPRSLRGGVSLRRKDPKWKRYVRTIILIKKKGAKRDKVAVK
jgi:hypothetical protein